MPPPDVIAAAVAAGLFVAGWCWAFARECGDDRTARRIRRDIERRGGR